MDMSAVGSQGLDSRPASTSSVLSRHSVLSNNVARGGFTESTSMNNSLESDNETLRMKLNVVRKENGQLVAHNHVLMGEVETVRYSLHRSVTESEELRNRVNELEQSTAELRTTLDASLAELAACAQRDADARRQLREANALIDMHNATVQTVRGELSDVKKGMKRTEAERDLALDSAEQIQASFEEFQRCVTQKLQTAEDQLKQFGAEKDGMLSDVQKLNAELEEARKRIVSSEHALAVERKSSADIKRQLVREATDLRATITKLTLRINVLETDLTAFDTAKKDNATMRRVNAELKRAVDRERNKLTRSLSELKDSRAQLSRLEAIASIVLRSRAKVLAENLTTGKADHHILENKNNRGNINSGGQVSERSENSVQPNGSTRVNNGPISDQNNDAEGRYGTSNHNGVTSSEVENNFPLSRKDGSNSVRVLHGKAAILSHEHNLLAVSNGATVLYNRDAKFFGSTESLSTEHELMNNQVSTSKDVFDDGKLDSVDVLRKGGSADAGLHNEDKEEMAPNVVCGEAAELEASLLRLEDERHRLINKVADLEHRLADAKVDKVSVDAQLMERTEQVVTAQQELRRCTMREAGLEREARKQAAQRADLDRCLNEKTSELFSVTARIKDLEEELNSLSTEFSRVGEESDAKSRELVILSSTMTRVKQLHAEHYRDMEVQTALLERRAEEAELRANQSESRCCSLETELEHCDVRCHALQASLTDMLAMTDGLKDEINRLTRDHETTTIDLQEQSRHAAEKAQALEAELSSLRDQWEATVRQLNASLTNRDEAIRTLDDRLTSAGTAEREARAEVESLEGDLEQRQAMLVECNVRIEELEQAHGRLQNELFQLEQSKLMEMTALKQTLDTTESLNKSTLADLARREEQVTEMTRTIRDLQAEKTKVTDDLRSQIKSLRRQLKSEQEECERRAAANTALRGDVERLTQVMRENDVTSHDSEEHIGKLSARLDETLRQLEESECEVADRNQQIEQLHEELNGLRESMSRNDGTLMLKQTELEQVREELRSAQCELEQRSARINQLDINLKERCTEAEQRFLRLDGLVKKAQQEVVDRDTQKSVLEEHVRNLHAALKDRTGQMQQLEDLVHTQRSHLEQDAHTIRALEQRVAALHGETVRVSDVNSQATDEIRISRDHIEKLQLQLTEANRLLTTTQMEHDRLARDLADAAELVQSKDAELTKFVRSMADCADSREHLEKRVARTEEEAQQAKEQYCRELASLRSCHEVVLAAREQESALLQSHLNAAEERQTALVAELRRMAQHLGSVQAELVAREDMIAGKEEEVARLEEKLREMVADQGMNGSKDLRRQPGRAALVLGRISSVPDLNLSAISHSSSNKNARALGACSSDGGGSMRLANGDDIYQHAQSLVAESYEPTSTARSTTIEKGSANCSKREKEHMQSGTFSGYPQTKSNNQCSNQLKQFNTSDMRIGKDCVNTLNVNSCYAEDDLAELSSLHKIEQWVSSAASVDGRQNSALHECSASNVMNRGRNGDEYVEGDAMESLQKMWNQLQALNDVNQSQRSMNARRLDFGQSGSQGSEGNCRSTVQHHPKLAAQRSANTTSTGITDPHHSRAEGARGAVNRTSGNIAEAGKSAVEEKVLPGGIFDEKVRIQNRLKALIGYKEPEKRTVATKSRIVGGQSECKKERGRRVRGKGIGESSQGRTGGVVTRNSVNVASTAVSHYEGLARGNDRLTVGVREETNNQVSDGVDEVEGEEYGVELSESCSGCSSIMSDLDKTAQTE